MYEPRSENRMCKSKTAPCVDIRFVPLFLSMIGSGCATTVVYVEDLPLHPLKAQTEPACTKADVEKLGEDECTARKRTLIVQSVAATVRVRAFWYDAEKGVQENVGTGVIIEGVGTILTAHHVIVDADYIIVTVRRIRVLGESLHVADHRQFPAKVAYSAADRDVALLVPTHPQKKEFLLAMKLRLGLTPMVAEEVMHFGQTSRSSDGVTDVWPVHTTGIGPQVQMKAISRGGDSGGPVVALDGRLIGIVLANNVDDPDPEAPLTFYMPIDYAIDALKEWFLKTRVYEVPIED